MILGIVIVTNNHLFLHSNIVYNEEDVRRVRIYAWLSERFYDKPLNIVKKGATFSDIINDYIYSSLDKNYVDNNMLGIDMDKSSQYLNSYITSFMQECDIENPLPEHYKDLTKLSFTVLELQEGDFEFFHNDGVCRYVYPLSRMHNFWAQAIGTRRSYIF